MRNDERFIMTLEEVVAAVKRHPGSRDNECAKDAFWRVVRADAKVSRQDAEDFENLWTIRNNLVHHSHNGHRLVHVTSEAMKVAQRLHGKICERLLTVDLLRSEVATVSPTQRLAEACRLMGEYDYSALPVVEDGRIIGLLSSEDVVSWAGLGLGSLGLLEDARVGDVMHAHAALDYVVISRTRPIREVPSLFACAVTTGSPLGAALITSTGRPDEKLLGIITPWDLADVAGSELSP